MFDALFTLGFVGAVAVFISGFIWQSPPEARVSAPPASPAYYPVLGLLVLALAVVFGGAVLPGIHWDQVALWLRGEL